MKISQLQSFVALADTHSFTEAAYAIDLTQSAVSHALAALESELGVTLIERNRKGVVALTDAGQRVLPHVRAMLAQAEAIEQEAKAARGEAAGKLRLGSIEAIVAPQLLAGVLNKFRGLYPDIKVVLFEGAMHEVGEWIEQSVVDVGFVVLPARELECQQIMVDEMCVLVPTGHRLQARGKVAHKELRNEGFVMEKTQCTLSLMKRAGFEANQAKEHIRFHASDSATILEMVREGLGVTLMPRRVIPKKLEGVVALSFEVPQPLPIGLGVRAQVVASRGAKLFMRVAEEWAQEHIE